MGLAMPDEFLPYDGSGDAAAAPASAPGRLILRVEGQAEGDAFLAAYAAEQPQGEAQQPAGGVQLPAACSACGATPVGGFVAAAHQPVPSFMGSCLIVSTACSSCSARAVEVRSSGGVSAQGSRLRWAAVGRSGCRCRVAMFWPCLGVFSLAGCQLARECADHLLSACTPPARRLRVEEPGDLERAVLQSASASVAVPELELVSGQGRRGVGAPWCREGKDSPAGSGMPSCAECPPFDSGMPASSHPPPYLQALSTGSNAGMATTVGQLIGNVRLGWMWEGRAHGCRKRLVGGKGGRCRRF